MPTPPGLQLYITSADGTRRRLARANVETVTTTLERMGGYGQATIVTSLPYHQAGALTVRPGDRVETFYGGKRRYRGYVSALAPSGEEPRKVVITAFGAAALLRKQFCDKVYAFPQGGVDVSAAFAQLAQDSLLKATGPGGFRLIQSVQSLPIGTTVQTLDARRKLAGDALDGLVKEAGNLAVWGCDVDAAGLNRLYLRPLAPAAPPTHAVAVPGRAVLEAGGEEQTADLVNQLLVTGGAPTYPNLLHNGGFELPIYQQDGAGNLVVNGDFEGAQDDHTVSNWGLSGGAQSFTTFSIPPKQAAPYTGKRCLGLEGTGQSATQTAQAVFVAGHNYVFSARAAKEIDQQVATGRAQLQVTGSGGAVLLTATVALAPSGQGYDYFSATFLAPAGATGLKVTLSCDALDSSQVPSNNGYSGGLLIDDVQCYDVSVVYQDGWAVDVVDGGAGHVNAVNWVYQDAAFEGGYCVYLDAAAQDNDGHDLNLQPLAGSRFSVTPSQTLRYGVWVKSPPASLNPQPPKFFLELNFYDSSGRINRTPPRATFSPGFLAQWTYFELVAYALDGEVSADANLTWRSAGSLLVDAQSVRDVQAAPMAAASGGAVPAAPFLPAGPLFYVIRASDPYLNGTWRPANGLPQPAAYAGSEAAYGPRCAPFADPSILRLDDAMAVADATFRTQAAPLFRPTITLADDARLYWPGETVRLIGADGPSLQSGSGQDGAQGGEPLAIARVTDSYDGLLKTRLELEKEQPDVSLTIKKIVEDMMRRLGLGGAPSAGEDGGYSARTGGGGATSPVYRATLTASPADPTLHDAYTGVPHAGQASQDGWSATSGEVAAARTRTVKGVSSLNLEGRLDAMEADIASGGGGAAGAGDHKVALSAVDGSPDYLDAKTGAVAPLSVADGGGVRVWRMAQAGAGEDGWLSASDWDRFNAVTTAPGVPTVPSWVYECLDAAPVLSDLSPFRPAQMTPLITLGGDLVDTNALGASRTTVWGQKAYYTTKLVVLQAKTIQVDCTADNSAQCYLNGAAVGGPFGNAVGGPGTLGTALRISLPLQAGPNLLRFQFSQDDDGGGANSGFTCRGVGSPLAFLVDQQLAPMPRPDSPSLVSLAPFQAALTPGANYRLTADLSGAGAFADAGYCSWFTGGNGFAGSSFSGTVIIQEDKALWSPTFAAWTVWLRPPAPNGYTAPPPSQETFAPTLKGLWDGPAGVVQPAYALQQIA